MHCPNHAQDQVGVIFHQRSPHKVTPTQSRPTIRLRPRRLPLSGGGRPVPPRHHFN
jgi:hypothetical protein